MPKDGPMERKVCFIVTPIGSDGTSTRRASDGVRRAVIEPVLEEMGIASVVSHEISETGSITNQVITHILNDHLVVANLTGLNPNVMYELAVRHCVGKPVVTIAEHDTLLPFDLYSERTIFYSDDMLGATELRNRLADAIRATLEEKVPDNPVYRVSQSKVLREASANGDVAAQLIDRMDSLESRIASSLRRATQSLDAPRLVNPRSPFKTDAELTLRGEPNAIRGFVRELVAQIPSRGMRMDEERTGDETSMRVRLDLFGDTSVAELSRHLNSLALIHGVQFEWIAAPAWRGDGESFVTR